MKEVTTVLGLPSTYALASIIPKQVHFDSFLFKRIYKTFCFTCIHFSLRLITTHTILYKLEQTTLEQTTLEQTTLEQTTLEQTTLTDILLAELSQNFLVFSASLMASLDVRRKCSRFRCTLVSTLFSLLDWNTVRLIRYNITYRYNMRQTKTVNVDILKVSIMQKT